MSVADDIPDVTGGRAPRAPVLALDIGNVCLSIEPERCARRLGHESMSGLVSVHPALAGLVSAVETGRLGTEQFLAQACSVLGDGTSHPDLREAWAAVLGDEIPGISGLVNYAHGCGVKAVFISDTSAFHYALLQPMLSFMPLVAGAVLSYEVGVRKPDARMFEALEQQYCAGTPPLLYIDDRRANTEAAMARGWRSYHFGTPEGARDALDEALAGEGFARR